MNKATKNSKLRPWLKQHPGAALLLACYGLALVLFLALHLAAFAQNRAAYASGALAPGTLTLADFEPAHEAEIEGDTLRTLGKDPQLVLKDTERKVENLSIRYTATRQPLLQQAFWAEPGQDYALRSTAYARATGGGQADGQGVAQASGQTSAQTSGQVHFWLPPAGGQSLRLDPDIQADNTFTIEAISINQKRSFWAFFVPGAGEVALYLALPGLAACLSCALRQTGWPARLWAKIRAKIKGGKTGGKTPGAKGAGGNA